MGTSKSSQNTTSTQTQQTQFAPRTAQEQALLDQFSGLGAAQDNTLLQLNSEYQNGRSPFAMDPAAEKDLDAAYKGALDQLMLENKDYADYLSGGRGMRMSDSPIADQAIQRASLGVGNLMSNKAMARLNLGLAGNQYRTNLGLMSAQALPSGSVAAFNPLFNERMQGGLTTMTGFQQGSGSMTQPVMQSILQGTQAYNNIAQGTSSLAGTFAGMG